MRSYLLLQQLPMLLQPGLRLFHGRRLRPDDVPEPGSVVGFDKVSEFMDDNVVDDEHRRFDQAPVKVDIIVQGAGAPAKAVTRDLDPSNINAQFAGMKFHPRDKLFFGLVDIPIPQGFYTLTTPARRSDPPPAGAGGILVYNVRCSCPLSSFSWCST